MANAKKLVPILLKWEGGYVNDPLDKGGETNKGITISTWKSFGYDVSEKILEIKVGSKTYKNVTKSLYEMTDNQWYDIFKKLYWDKWLGDKINNQSIANILVDWVWSSGGSTIKRVQKILGVKADGIVGNKTIDTINSANQEQLFEKIKNDRIVFVNNIVNNNLSQARFINGWINRINSFNF